MAYLLQQVVCVRIVPRVVTSRVPRVVTEGLVSSRAYSSLKRNRPSVMMMPGLY